MEKSAPFTYFMSNGFYGGYFGIQEHDEGKKFALFSVWDAGSKVEIVDWGEGVSVGRFGNEGTGANSKMPFQWKIGEPVRFLVHTKVEEAKDPSAPKNVLYSGFIHWPEKGIWRLMARLRVQPCGLHVHTDGMLLAMNSFIEVFGGPPKKPNCEAYNAERRARYGPPWYKTSSSKEFKQFPEVSMTATCPKSGCPKQGLNFWSDKGGSSESFVLSVGGNVTNNGLPINKPSPILQSQRLSSVVANGELPFGDNSPADSWSTGSRRPLRRFGKEDGVKRWGNGGDDFACPWYVVDCGSQQ